MHSIEKTAYGIAIRLRGSIGPEEMTRWVDDERWFLPSLRPHEFGMVVDARELEPLSQESQIALQRGLRMLQERGLRRSAVVVDREETRAQILRTSQESGIDGGERWIDASSTPSWTTLATEWVASGREPADRTI